MIKTYDNLPWIARLIIVIVFGAIVGGIYRIVKFLENKNTKTLVFGILSFVPLTAPIFWIADIISVITKGKIVYLVD